MITFSPHPACPDLWQYLRQESAAGRPVVLYGMGNGADKIIHTCHGYGIPVSDVFASDGFVRGHLFHGKRVLSFSEVIETYGAEKLIVLLSFGSSRPEVLETIRATAARCELYIPDMPVSGDDLFTADFVARNREKIHAARALFADGESVRVFDGIIGAKLSGRLDLLEATACEEAETWRILPAGAFRTAMDLGAYTGDSLRTLLDHTPRLEAALCMEPDARTFRKLSACAETLSGGNRHLTVAAVNKGAWSENTTCIFHGTGNRNASLLSNAQTKETLTGIPVATPASEWEAAFPGRRIDYIKYDVEGAERQALLGSRALIERDAPALLVSAYHAAADLFALPLLVHELNPAYRLYLRRMVGVPAWDINLYAVTE